MGEAHDGPADLALSAIGGERDLAVFADWITEDVVQRLYASRQDLAEAVLETPEIALQVEPVRDHLLSIIDTLRALAGELNAATPDGPTARRVEQLTAAVADQCEGARALVAQSALLLARNARIREESARLARDSQFLRVARRQADDHRRGQRARDFALDVHRDHLDQQGRSMVDHVERVAAGVPQVAQVVAFVHDVCERTTMSPADVGRMLGLRAAERDALVLLTKLPGELVPDHMRRIVASPVGNARDLAVVIKRADLDDQQRFADTSDSAYIEARALLDG